MLLMHSNTFHFVPQKHNFWIHALPVSKTTPKDTISIRIIKENYDILGPKMLTDFNSSVAFGIFPKNQKLADVPSIFKAEGGHIKDNF